MNASELLVDLYGRMPELVGRAVEGVDTAGLRHRPVPDANSIGWLLWHQARVQDHQFAELTAADQLWVVGDFASTFGLARDPGNTGYGHDNTQVSQVQPESGDAVIDYATAVNRRAINYLEGLEPEQLDRVIDDSYDPPVVLGVRLVSVAGDCLQHLGQAAYLRGLLTR